MSKRKAPSASAKQKHKRCSVPKPAKETVKAALNSMVLQIEKKKADNEENKTPYGTITGFVTDNKQMFPWLTVNKIKYHMRKLNKKLSSMEAEIMDEEVEETNEQRDGDAAMPSTKNLLLARYEETKHRGELA